MALENKQTTLHLIHSQESKPIDQWRQLYPDQWLFIEVTREDVWEVYEGKLIATAEDPMDLVETEIAYDKRNIVTLKTRGIYTEPQPAFVG